MKPIEILQGKWLGHSLHAALVHLPVGAWLAALVLDLATWSGTTRGGPGQLAFYCVAAGLIGALLAVGPGLADWLAIKPGKPARKLGIAHLLLNLLATAVWGGNFALRLDDPARLTPAILGTSITGTLFVLIGAYLGARLVFDHGIGVARFSKKTWRTRAIHGGARVPDEN